MKHNIKTAIVFLLFLSVTIGCRKSILDEKALTFLSPDALRDKASFEAVLVSLHAAARNENFRVDGRHRYGMDLGTDVMRLGDPTLPEWKSYPQELVPTGGLVNYWWDWGFLDMLPRANAIISNVQKVEVISQADRNALEAEARFFRAYTYNAMVNIFGGVPIVDRFYNEPKTDFTRASREEVLAFAQADLEFAAQHLPVTALQGRITKGAANHLLSEVYISRKNWDKAIAAASAVIDGGQYSLMQQGQRFGKYRDSAGTNIFWDLFREGSYNHPNNKEDIWVIQFEFGTPGGGANTGIGNNLHRGLARWFDTKDPDNKDGMTRQGPVVSTQLNRYGDKVGDTLNRGVGWLRPTDYWTYNIWTDPNDIRNSNSNIRRKWYYNNPASAYFRQEVIRHRWLDTMFHLYPIPTKFEGVAPLGFGNAQTNLDQYKMRLAETYLLRAEAYLGKEDKANAAADINVVRSRAGAAPVAAADVTIDYILDERARELFMEEPRRRTLVRLGKLVERTRTFNSYVTGFPCPATGPCNPGQPGLGATIQPHHALFPIPQSFISANTGAVIQQNPGY